MNVFIITDGVEYDYNDVQAIRTDAHAFVAITRKDGSQVRHNMMNTTIIETSEEWPNIPWQHDHNHPEYYDQQGLNLTGGDHE